MTILVFNFKSLMPLDFKLSWAFVFKIIINVIYDIWISYVFLLLNLMIDDWNSIWCTTYDVPRVIQHKSRLTI
jgi:hypothetical protein